MPSAATIANIYNRTKISTATHATDITLLHHRCVQFIQLSLEGSSPKRKLLNQAQNILAQFQRSLDKQNGLANSFFLLYDYCYCMLETDNRESHQAALNILIKIRNAFDTLLHRKEC